MFFFLILLVYVIRKRRGGNVLCFVYIRFTNPFVPVRLIAQAKWRPCLLTLNLRIKWNPSENEVSRALGTW